MFNRKITFIVCSTLTLCLIILIARGMSRETDQLTTQKILPTGFSYFENLYFHPAKRMFYTIGNEINLEKAIYTVEKRGFVWEKYKRPPFSLRERAVKRMPGTSVIVFERTCTSGHVGHYFHFLEHLLGIWNFGGEERKEDVKLVLLAFHGEEETPKNWKGPNEVTAHLIRALFPHAEVKVWADFVQGNREDLCFEKVITSDRAMEFRKQEPYGTDRMLGGYFQSLSKESSEGMVDVVHAYAGVKKRESKKKLVTYVKRSFPRRLVPEMEEKLLARIRELRGVELRVVDFAEMNFQEQIRAVANTDVLLGVHGNGLSHTLFLPKGATLIELFPSHSFRVEYRIFAKLRGVNYYGLTTGEGWIGDSTAERVGWFGEINYPIEKLDIDAIISVIKEQNDRHTSRTL